MTTEPATETTQPTNPRRWPWIVGIVAALFVGLLIGGAAAGSDPATAPEPEVITETVTETETVEVEVTPEACRDALDYAEATIRGYEDLIELKSELIDLTMTAAVEIFIDDESTFDDQLDEYNVRQDALIDEKDEALTRFVTAGFECNPDW